MERYKQFLTADEAKSAVNNFYNQDVYVQNRNRPEVIKKYFTPEEVAFHEAQLAKELKINPELGAQVDLAELAKLNP